MASKVSILCIAVLLASPTVNAAETGAAVSGAPDLAGGTTTATTVIGRGSCSGEEESKTLAVGDIDVLDCDFSPQAIPGNPSLIKVEPGTTTKQLRVTPQKKGTVTVVISDERGRTMKKINYNIITNNLSQKVAAIRELLYDVEGITIGSLDDKIVIDGELIVPRDFDRLIQVQQAYPEVLNLVSLSKISREAIARRIQKEINDDPGGVNVQVKIINDTFFLLGKVDSSADKERAETIAQTYMPEILAPAAKDFLIPGAKKFSIRNLIVLEEAPPPATPKMVRVTYHFVEIGKDFLKNSFFKWVPLLSEGAGLQFGQSTTGGVASSSGGSFAGTITSLLPKLASGANGGFSRVLFSTVGIGEEGTPIEIVRADQIPFISAVVNGVPIPSNARAEMTVQVTPTILGEDKMRLQNRIVFQAFKGAGAGGAPGVTQSTIQNQIIIKSGDSAALGGLIHSDTAKDIDRDPEQAAAPAGNAIFTLLRSKAFRSKKTQFVVFITPKIISDAGEGTADIKAKIINNNKKRRRVIR
jgi:pilus assembly protein CpaC